MAIRPPALDDRSFDDLVAEMLRRIPAHTPEWTNPVVGDPGRTMIDLFGWLADTLLYRANLIPERQRLAFLRLLGAPMLAARPARGLLSLMPAKPDVTQVVALPRRTRIAKPVPFETEQEVAVMPMTAICVIKRKFALSREPRPAGFLAEVAAAYQLAGVPISAYITTPVFADAGFEPDGRDIVAESIDGRLWIALLAAKPDAVHVGKVRASLTGDKGPRPILNLGLVPAFRAPDFGEDAAVRRRIDHAWHVEAPSSDSKPRFAPLEIVSDGTAGLSRTGIVRLAMPGSDDVAEPRADVLADPDAGVGDRPPRLDDPALAARLVAWLRFTPGAGRRIESLRLAWCGINAVSIEQRESLGRRSLGRGTGASGLELSLGASSVDAASLEIEVEDESGMRRWRQIPDVGAAGFDEPVYSLDAEAGIIRFGDGMRGRVPAAGVAIDAARIRAGGGLAGNLAPGTIREIDKSAANGIDIKVVQPVPTLGGTDAEDLAACERRLPQLLRHRDRAVTADDFRDLARRAPGLDIARVEVLPRFRPRQRRFDAPGVVSVMVLPARSDMDGPAPRADRPMLEGVHQWLDERRPVGTELHVCGCEYVPVAASVGVEIIDPDERDAVLRAVRASVRRWLWPLPPGGQRGEGWPLGRAVSAREIEAAAARTPGVASVISAIVFSGRGGMWRRTEELVLEAWQLPELIGIAAAEGEAATSVDGLVSGPVPVVPVAVGVPIVPEVC